MIIVSIVYFGKRIGALMDYQIILNIKSIISLSFTDRQWW